MCAREGELAFVRDAYLTARFARIKANASPLSGVTPGGKRRLDCFAAQPRSAGNGNPMRRGVASARSSSQWHSLSSTDDVQWMAVQGNVGGNTTAVSTLFLEIVPQKTNRISTRSVSSFSGALKTRPSVMNNGVLASQASLICLDPDWLCFALQIMALLCPFSSPPSTRALFRRGHGLLPPPKTRHPIRPAEMPLLPSAAWRDHRQRIGACCVTYRRGAIARCQKKRTALRP